MSELSYAEIDAITYRASDIGVRLTKEQQSFLIQAVALFNSPSMWTDYETYYDEIAALVAASEYQLTVEEAYPVGSEQGRTTIWHRLGIVLAGAANTHVLDANQLYGHYVRQNPATILDSTYQDIWLAAGDYAFDVLYVRVSTAGKLRLTLEYQDDGSDTIIVSSGDLSGATAYNQHLNGNFTLTESGYYRLYTNVQAAGGSGGFFLPVTCVDIWRTG